jgi:hypothetical protein
MFVIGGSLKASRRAPAVFLDGRRTRDPSQPRAGFFEVSSRDIEVKGPRARRRLDRRHRRYRGGGHRRRPPGVVRLAPRRPTAAYSSQLTRVRLDPTAVFPRWRATPCRTFGRHTAVWLVSSANGVFLAETCQGFRLLPIEKTRVPLAANPGATPFAVTPPPVRQGQSRHGELSTATNRLRSS